MLAEQAILLIPAIKLLVSPLLGVVASDGTSTNSLSEIVKYSSISSQNTEDESPVVFGEDSKPTDLGTKDGNM